MTCALRVMGRAGRGARSSARNERHSQAPRRDSVGRGRAGNNGLDATLRQGRDALCKKLRKNMMIACEIEVGRLTAYLGLKHGSILRAGMGAIYRAATSGVHIILSAAHGIISRFTSWYMRSYLVGVPFFQSGVNSGQNSPASVPAIWRQMPPRSERDSL